jgi:GAF domain-containing protein
MSEHQNSEFHHDLVQRQAAASHALTLSTTYAEMAGAVARYMPLNDGQFVSLQRITREQSGTFHVQTLAWADASQSSEGGSGVEIPVWGQGYPLEALDEQVVGPVANHPRLNLNYRGWLEADKVTSFANFPVRFAGQVIGTLAVQSRSTPVNLSADVLSHYQVLANQLGALIQAVNLNVEVSSRQALIQRQSHAFAELNANMNYEQMAAAVARHMLPTSGRFLGISQLTYDAQGNISGWRILTSANRDRVYNWDHVPPMSWNLIAPALRQSIMDGAPFIVSSIQNARPEETSPELHNILSAIHVESYVNIPVLVGNKLAAVLLIMSRRPSDFTAEEINAFANLGDQMGTLIHSRTLFEEAQDAQKLALQLVETNRNIALTNSMEDIGQALLEALPATVTGLTIAMFNRPVQGREKPGNLETVVLADHQGIHKLNTIDRLAGDADGFSDTVWKLQNSEVIVLNPADAQKVLPLQSLTTLYENGAAFVTLVGLQAGTRLLGVLGLASNEVIDKTTQQGANLHALADQIGITLENRSLLAQTTESLNLVQMQFETSNTIYRSTNPAEILEAINRFAGATYQSAQIALLEPESDPPMLRIAAEIRDGSTQLTETLVPLDTYPAHQTLKSLETLYIPDVATDSYLSDAERSALAARQIDSMLIVPMVVNTNFVGLVAFVNRIKTAASSTGMRALRYMVDLAAVVVENRSLLQITGQSLEETQVLYEINRGILGAQDTLDVLRVLRELLAPDAASITEIGIVYEGSDHPADLMVNYINMPEGEQAIRMSLKDQIGETGLKRMKSYWDDNNSVITIIEDLDNFDRDYPMAQFVKMTGARSLVNIAVRQGDLVHQVISITFREVRRFSAGQRRLFISLSDQIGIVMQNHRLLHEAQQSAEDMSRRVGQLQGINQVSARILRATDEASMVNETSEALVKLLGIDHCGITLIDPNDTDYLVVAGEYPQRGALNVRLPLKNNPLWDALQRRNFQPLYISSREDALIEPTTREVLTNMGIFSMGLVPIVANNRIVGGVGLDMSSEDARITPEMLELAQILVVPLNIGLQNLQLLRSIQSGADRLSEQVETLRTLQEIEADISSAQDEPTLLKQSVKHMVELLKVDHCGIVLIDPSQTAGTVVSEYPEGNAVGLHFTVAGNPLYQFTHGERYNPVVIKDIETDPTLSDESRASLRSVGAKGMVVIPLVVQNRVIGSVGIDQFTAGQAISDTMIDLALTVSSQIALALQNRRLVSEAERRASQLQHIAAFNQRAQASLDMSRTLQTMINEASEMLPQNQISVSLFDLNDGQLKVVAQRTDDGLKLSLTDGDVIPLTGQMETVWTKAEPMYIADLRAATPDMDVGITLRSWLLVPVMAHGSVSGIVSVGSDQPYAYSETDIRLFSQLVTQFGVVLENIDAYQQSQKVARNESLVNDISAQLQRQMDIQGMLNVTAAQLGKAIGARRARIRLATSIPETDPESSAE